MFDRFTERSRQVVILAQAAAQGAGRDSIETTALLIGLWQEEHGIGRQVLESLNSRLSGILVPWLKNEEAGFKEFVDDTEKKRVQDDRLPFTSDAKKVLELALREALSLGHNYIGTEHILLGLVRNNSGIAARRLASIGLDGDEVRNEVVRKLGHGRTPSPDPIVIDPLDSTRETALASWRNRALEAERKLDEVGRLVRSLRGVVG